VKLFFDDPEFDGQLQRTAAKTACRAADLGQVLAVARRIVPGDYDSWYAEWFAEGAKEAERAKARAGNRTNSGEAWLRASECYRSAFFFVRRDPHGSRLLEAWRHSRDAFRAALPSLPFAIDAGRIPYQDIHLEGYVLRAGGGRSAP